MLFTRFEIIPPASVLFTPEFQIPDKARVNHEFHDIRAAARYNESRE